MLKVFLVCAAAVAGIPRRSSAEEIPVSRPVLIAAVKSVDTLLANIDDVFGASGNDRYAQVVRGFVANLNGLKGVDRSRPFGVMVFAPDAPGGQPKALFFLAVASIEDLKSSVRLGNVISLENGATSEQFSLKTPEKSIPVTLAHGYAYLTEEATLLEGSLPSPDDAVAPLLEHYDAVVTLRRDGLPELFVNLAREALTNLSSQPIPRDRGDSDADYQLKKDVAALGFDVAGSLLSDVEQINLGWKLQPHAESFDVEASLVCRPDGPVLDAVKQLNDSPARFQAVTAEPSPLAIVYHLNLPPRIRTLLEGILSRIREHAAADMKAEAAVVKPHVLATLETLQKTVKAGRIDGFLQVVGGPPNHFYTVGGVGLVDEAPLAAALRAVLPFAGDTQKGRNVELDALRIDSTDFHRIANLDARPEDRLLYGDDMSLLVGAGQSAIWFALGGDEARQYLPTRMVPPATDGDSRPDPLLLIQFHLTDWLGLIGENADEPARNFRAIAQRAFPAPEDDQIEFSVAATPTGLRLRLSFEQGFLRLIGHAVAASQQR